MACATPVAEGQCGLCYSDDIDAEQLSTLKCCHFRLCPECLRTHYEMQIEEGATGISCPNCPALHDRRAVEEYVSSGYVDKLNQSRGAGRQLKKACPQCASEYTLEGESLSYSPSQDIVQCASCKFEWCFKCTTPVHSSITCQENQRGEILLRGWARTTDGKQTNARKCPKCKIWIQRAGGCPFMTCSRCKTNFCYLCGRKFDSWLHRRGLCDRKVVINRLIGICFWFGIPVALLILVVSLSYRYMYLLCLPYIPRVPAVLAASSFITAKYCDLKQNANFYLKGFYVGAILTAGLADSEFYRQAALCHLTSVATYGTWYVVREASPLAISHYKNVERIALVAASVPVLVGLARPGVIELVSSWAVLGRVCYTYKHRGLRVLSLAVWTAWTFRTFLCHHITTRISNLYNS